MVPPEGQVFGRPGNRQALNRAYKYLDLVPKGRDEDMASLAGSTGTGDGHKQEGGNPQGCHE